MREREVEGLDDVASTEDEINAEVLVWRSEDVNFLLWAQQGCRTERDELADDVVVGAGAVSPLEAREGVVAEDVHDAVACAAHKGRALCVLRENGAVESKGHCDIELFGCEPGEAAFIAADTPQPSGCEAGGG